MLKRLFQLLPSGPVLGGIGAVTLMTATATVLLVAGVDHEPVPSAPLSAEQPDAGESGQSPSQGSPSAPALPAPSLEGNPLADPSTGDEAPFPATNEHSEHAAPSGQQATGQSSPPTTTTTITAIGKAPPTTSATPSSPTTTTSPVPTTTSPVPTTTEPEHSHDPPSNTTTTTSTPTPTTTTPTPTTTQPGRDSRLVIDRDTMIHTKLVLRSGDSIEFRNGARLMFGMGGYADWQGTPTTTWSNDGRIVNLNRDIEIFGDGDIMFMAGSRPSTIRYVEIDLQPKQELGHYPLHFHLMGEDSRGSLVEGVVVKNSTNRAYVTHGSHGITVKDSIAANIKGEAFWWDVRGSTDPENPSIDDSHDTVWDRNLMVGVTNGPLSPKFRMSAMQLGGGARNVANDNVVLNFTSVHGADCSAYHWPSGAGGSVWEFTGNKAIGGNCNGIFVWQNDQQHHFIRDFVARTGQACARHGAYTNKYQYIDADCDVVEVLAVERGQFGPRFLRGSIEVVVFEDHVSDGPIHFEGTQVGRVHINNGIGTCTAPGDYHFTNTGLSFADVTTGKVCPGTTLTINGMTRSYGG